MTIRPDRALARFQEIEKIVKTLRDNIAQCVRDMAPVANEALELDTKALELTTKINARTAELVEEAQKAGTAVTVEGGSVMVATTDETLDGLIKERTKFCQDAEVVGARHAEYFDKKEKLEAELEVVLPVYNQRKAAYERKVREYPVALARHLRHMRHSGMKDIQGRTKKTVAEARQAAAALGEEKTLDECLAAKLAGE